MSEFSTLIGVDDLAAHWDASHPLGTPAWAIIDCRFTLSDPTSGHAAYAKARIPGAHYANLEQDLSAPRTPGSGRNPMPAPAAFAEALSRWAIHADTQVVVYDDSFGSIACRLWWLLRAAGHRKVALLDGGWPVWKRKKHPIDESPLNAGAPSARAVRPIDFNQAMLADAAQVDSIRLDPAWALIDARPEERFTGERDTTDPIAGHIPGSRNWTFEDNLGYDGCFLPATELRDNFATLLDGRAPTQLIHTCGSGVTACHSVLAMEHAGLAGSRLYVGSWSEWISDPRRPIATGTD